MEPHSLGILVRFVVGAALLTAIARWLVWPALKEPREIRELRTMIGRAPKWSELPSGIDGVTYQIASHAGVDAAGRTKAQAAKRLHAMLLRRIADKMEKELYENG